MSATHLPLPFQFSLFWLLRTISVYGFACGIAVFVRLPPMQVLLGLCILTGFVMGEVGLLRPAKPIAPWVANTNRLVAYYATAFAVATLACGAVFLGTFVSDSPGSNQTGLAAALRPIVTAIFLVLLYLGAFSLFSSTAFVSALFAARHFRLGWWLAAIHFPGFLLGCYLFMQLIRFILYADWEIEDVQLEPTSTKFRQPLILMITSAPLPALFPSLDPHNPRSCCGTTRPALRRRCRKPLGYARHSWARESRWELRDKW